MSGEHGFYVLEGERNRSVGQMLFNVVRAVLQGMGAQLLTVEQPSEKSNNFYEKNGGTPQVSGY